MYDRGLPPVAARARTGWPSWPGWLIAILGGATAVSGLVAVSLESEGLLQIQNPGVLLGAIVGGSIAATFGLLYECLRSIRARRNLPPDRYRGPSPLLLLVLAVLAATAVALPFSDDVTALLEGRELSALGSIVLLTSTQAALLLVTALFVTWPNALAGAPSFAAGRPARSVALGIGWGALAWVVANLIGAAVAVGLESMGVPTEQQAAEQALAVLDPFIAILAVVGLAPLAEEIFFRGVAYAGWRREHGVRRARIGAAVLFAVIHASLVAFLPILILGLWLAWLYERTRSLLAAVSMHATFNAISVALALLVRYEVINLPV